MATFEQVCGAYASIWECYLKAKNINLDVKHVLVHLLVGDSDWDDPSLCVLNLSISCLCRKDAHTMAQNLPHTPPPPFS